MQTRVVLRLLTPFLLAVSAFAQAPGAADGKAVVKRLCDEAAALQPLVKSDLAHRFLAATANLPEVPPRTLYRTADKKDWLSEEQAKALPREQFEALSGNQFPAEFYYYTKYGSPLAYVRALDVLAQAGLKDVAGKRIADFGYGSIGHLRLLASLGAQTMGIDVDPQIRALYETKGDQGAVKSEAGPGGRVTVLNGRWPAEEAVKAAAGGKFDVFMSKNTLKKGYVSPERPADERMLIKLGVDSEAYVKAVFDALNPGGRFLIYNLCPAQNPADQPYKPMADGRCPFPREMLEKAGFRMVEFDHVDNDPARAMGHALGWDEGSQPMDLKSSLFAWYTLVEKP